MNHHGAHHDKATRSRQALCTVVVHQCAAVAGQPGGAVARRLHADGWRVRGLTRDPDSERARPARELGIELMTGDLTDEPSLAAPLAGVYGVFAMATPFEKGMENGVAGQALMAFR